MSFTAINPATEEVIAEYPNHTHEEIEAALQASVIAFKDWRASSFKERAELMVRAAEILDAEVDAVDRMGGAAFVAMEDNPQALDFDQRDIGHF